MKKLLSAVLCVCLLMASCASPLKTYQAVQQKSNDDLSQAVYATNDSIHSGRFDLAEKYSDQSTRLIAPPANRIPIQQFIIKGAH